MNQSRVDNLLLKLVENRISEQESEDLAQWLKSEENQIYFNEFVEFNHLLNSRQPFGSDTKLPYGTKTSENRFSFTTLLKYAAVILIVAASALFFTDGLFSTNDPIVPTAPMPVVTNNKIRPGINTAVLTLGDGSEIDLGKGADYTTETLVAKEDQVVYSPKGSTREVTYNYLTVPRGGEFFLQLSDGSKAWLNSDTKLKYPVEFIQGQSREVFLLYGEVYFEVTSSTENDGNDFKVYHKDQEIQVLGTQFNVKAYGDESEVLTTLVEGKVAVNNGKQFLEMTPGEQSRFDLGTGLISIAQVDTYSETSWKSGVFSFKEKSLKDIMRTLSRWYDMEVIFENRSLEDKRFKGVLRKSQSIEEVLSVIMSSSLNSYEINDRTVILK